MKITLFRRRCFIEIWKDIPQYNGLYQVSNLGRVRSQDRIDSVGRKHKGVILKPLSGRGLYLCVNICVNGIHKSVNIHRLVAEAFIPNPQKLPQVNHKDEDKHNNNAENLEWCDAMYNINYGTRTDKYRGGKHKCAVLSEKDVLYIRSHYVSGDPEFGGVALARKFSVCTSTISFIVTRQTWKHLL